jgi:hypothetical protein
MMVGALAGPVSFRMQCLYHDSYGAAISSRRLKQVRGTKYFNTHPRRESKVAGL